MLAKFGDLSTIQLESSICLLEHDLRDLSCDAVTPLTVYSPVPWTDEPDPEGHP